MRAILLMAAMAMSCGGPAEPADLLAEANSALASAGVQFLNGGRWVQRVGGPGCESYPPACLRQMNLWVDLKVPNRCFQKQVGIVWRDNLYNVPAQGAAWPVAAAKYEGALPDGYEQWGVDLTVATINGRQPDEIVVELAAFATQCGSTSWDNNGGKNYQLR
jgi:hypothetical protein